MISLFKKLKFILNNNAGPYISGGKKVSHACLNNQSARRMMKNCVEGENEQMEGRNKGRKWRITLVFSSSERRRRKKEKVEIRSGREKCEGSFKLLHQRILSRFAGNIGDKVINFLEGLATG